MMVNLRVLREIAPVLAEQSANGIEIRRAQLSESDVIADWVRESINPNWRVVCEVAIEQTPSCCFIAVRKKSAGEPFVLAAENLIGFACYDVVTKGVFGPSAVREDEPDNGISTALLLACLHAMAADDYAHATIGWASTTDNYSGRT